MFPCACVSVHPKWHFCQHTFAGCQDSTPRSLARQKRKWANPLPDELGNCTSFDTGYEALPLCCIHDWCCSEYHRKDIWEKYTKICVFLAVRMPKDGIMVAMLVRWHSTVVIGNGIIEKLAYAFLFAFCGNYGRVFNRLWDIQHQTMARP